MYMTKTTLALTIALGAAGIAQAATGNPFAMQSLNQGYQMAGADKKMEGKCGGKKAMEAKCGGEMATMPKAHDGKCGADMAKPKAKSMEGKCGGEMAKPKAKPMEGKCGGK